ncbi:MAG TPA: DMT family transporter [Candidatus Dorea gallistercoris]|uniref:DMT family transporter n=1 Tax=Candidatus Dorea gallistercoris TaxID=2838542 RepID=A0A9D1RDU3_9FIRM|nr:DMT family transporter [Candidatus Dorea gallistercoris]
MFMNKTDSPEKKILYISFILIQSLVYGIGNPLTKVAYHSISPLWLLAARFSLAFLLFALLWGKRLLAAARQVSWTLWMPSALCCAGAYISCNLALDLTAATNVGFIMSLPVLFAPILFSLVFHRPYSYKRLPLQLVTILGLFLLCCNTGTFSFGPGEALALLDALCLAGVLVFGEKAMAQMDVLSVTGLQIGVTMVLSLAGALLFDDVSVLPSVELEAWLVVLYLAAVCTIAAYLLQNKAVAHLNASTVSMLQCTQPILTALVAYFLLGETLNGLGLAGAVLIVLCLLADGRYSSL